MSPNPDNTSPTPWNQPRWIIAAVVVALVAVMGVTVAALGGRGEGKPRAPSTAATPTARGSTSATGSPAGCDLPSQDQTIPAAPPANTKWELVGSVAAPSSPAAGPAKVFGAVRKCFAQTPTGALFAAANAVAVVTTPSETVRFLETQAAPGPGREAALAEFRQSPPTSSGAVQIAGFSLLNYTREAATIDLAISDGEGGLGHLPVTMRWIDGDWRLELPPTGDLAATVGQLPDLTGYVPWRGV